MSFNLDSTFFGPYYEAVDELIENSFIGKTCKLYYPEIKEECPNCVAVDVFGSTSANIYNGTGPIPFSLGLCPVCHGQGYKSNEQTEEIKLRVYADSKNWIKIGKSIEIPVGRVQVIGKMGDGVKLKRSQKIQIRSDKEEFGLYFYSLAGDIHPHGFGSQYFVAYLDRV